MRRSFAASLSTYEAIHKKPINRAIHAIGIPAIITSIFGLAGLVRIAPLWEGADLTLATLLAALTLAITMSWSWRAFLAFAPLMAACFAAAIFLSPNDPLAAIAIWSAAFIAGWAVQFLGHAFEGHAPEFVSRPENLLLGPISVSLEVLPFLRP